MGIPSYGRMHIPSCDFANLISPAMVRQFGLPILQRKVRTMTHNVFHVDDKRIARHLDTILSVPEVHAIQWVQGVGDDQPIMQCVAISLVRGRPDSRLFLEPSNVSRLSLHAPLCQSRQVFVAVNYSA